MSGRVTVRLRELGITLPKPPNPAANYIPARRSGSLLFVAGQVPKADGKDQFVGKLGCDISVEDGQKAARLCAINILAQVSAALDAACASEGSSMPCRNSATIRTLSMVRPI
jgi:enamine deaminase RidA (YjgF/YER057c/UK114 family)